MDQKLLRSNNWCHCWRVNLPGITIHNQSIRDYSLLWQHYINLQAHRILVHSGFCFDAETYRPRALD